MNYNCQENVYYLEEINIKIFVFLQNSIVIFFSIYTTVRFDNFTELKQKRFKPVKTPTFGAF